MTDEAMSPLRRRMIEDMTIRKLAPKTQHDYVQRVKNFAAFIGRSPDMASFEDVRRYQLHLATSGVGVPKVISLKVSDIDSKQMIIRVEQGKGGKDRNVMLSPSLLDLLRTWWRAARPRGWLFPGRDPAQPMTTRQLNRACHAAAQMAEINKRVSLHTLRHSFATHLLEQNIDVRVIQVLLGHAKLDTTALYTRVATKTISEVMSPLEHIALKPS